MTASADPVWLGGAPSPGQVVDLPDHDLVMWADADGTVTVCDSRCPHQWSHFAAEGVVVGDHLVCRSHLWRFDSEGRGSKVAMSGREDRKGDVAVYPSEVRGQEVWAWL